MDATDSTAGKRDVVRLKGMSFDDVEFRSAYSGYTNEPHLVIVIKETGETLTIRYGLSYNPTYRIQAVEFGDGTVMELEDIVKTSLHGTDGGDSINLNFASTYYAGQGNDVVTGSAFNDSLYGEDGNDNLTAGAGDDVYIFGQGNGQDTINNNGGGNDTLSFGDINPAELWFGKSGYHLSIGLVGSTDKVTVNNWFYGTAYQIDTIETGNQAITESQVALMIQAVAAIGAPGGADGQWTDDQREALAPVLATYWQPRG